MEKLLGLARVKGISDGEKTHRAEVMQEPWDSSGNTSVKIRRFDLAVME